MKNVLTSLCLIMSFSLCAQNVDFDNYKPLKSSGEIPQHVVESSSKKYQDRATSVNAENSRRKRRVKQEFLLISTFGVDAIFESGKVLFNDPISVYANQVLDKLLEHDKELRSELKLYHISSSQVNAFCSSEGYIFVTTGLISKLNTEAELAYVLAHETVHYLESHSMEFYEETEEIERGKREYRTLSLDEKIIAKSAFSKDNEFEADREGLRILRKSGYSLKACSGVFNILQYTQAPFVNETYSKTMLEAGGFILPRWHLSDSLSPLKGDADYDDKTASHPNIVKRKQKISELIEEEELKKGSVFLVSEDKFREIRKVARYELCRLYQTAGYYDYALYCSSILLAENPDSKYLNNQFVKSLYALTKYKNKKKITDVVISPSNQEGSIQQVSNIFYSITRKELNVLAICNTWEVMKKMKGKDSELELIFEDLLYELRKYNVRDKDFFTEQPMPDSILYQIRQKGIPGGKVDINPKLEELKKLLKDSKLNVEIKVESGDNPKLEEYLKYSLGAFLRDDEFKKRFDDLYKGKNRRKKRDKYSDDKILFYQPTFMKIDERKKQPIQYEASEESEQISSDLIIEIADLANLEVEVFNRSIVDEVSAEYFNKNRLMNDWMLEKARFTMEDYIVPTDYILLEEFMTEYGTSSLCLFGKFNIVNKDDYWTEAALVFVNVAFLPVAVYSAVKPNYSTVLYSVLINLENGEIRHVILKEMPTRDRKDLYRASLYDMMLQMKNEID